MITEWMPIESAPKKVVRGQRVHSIKDRIMRNITVNPQTGCWEWQGSVYSDARPYGRMMVGSRQDDTRRKMAVHRASYEAFVGPIPNGLYVCHRCDNPRCANPSHLFLGTAKENADDRDHKGRCSPAPTFYGEQASWAKLTNAQVDEIRSSSLSSRQIAPTYGVSDSHIRAIRRGKWRATPPAQTGEGE